jgi:hypothetical protein
VPDFNSVALRKNPNHNTAKEQFSKENVCTRHPSNHVQTTYILSVLATLVEMAAAVRVGSRLAVGIRLAGSDCTYMLAVKV